MYHSVVLESSSSVPNKVLDLLYFDTLIPGPTRMPHRQITMLYVCDRTRQQYTILPMTQAAMYIPTVPNEADEFGVTTVVSCQTWLVPGACLAPSIIRTNQDGRKAILRDLLTRRIWW